MPKRILVVEDDATIRDTLSFNLKKEGYLVTVAQDGAEALTKAREARADLILAFGAATWPHQLVRIMLMEQIYRALTILSGHPYHRD